MITFEDVSITYAGTTAPTLADVSFRIPEGDLAVVVGRTGTGKSTLLKAVNGLVPHFTGGRLTGRVLVAGRDTARNRPRDLADVVGFVGQDPLACFVTDMVEDEVAYGMEQLGLSPQTMRKRVEETLDLLGIAALRRRALADLSGGQQQRVAIAAVLAAQPRVLVLDEPTSALDPTAAQDVLAAITTLVHAVGLTVLLAEHRLERVLHQADTVVWLPRGGGLRVGRPADVLLDSDVSPPLAELARALGWPEVPGSVRDARRRAQREQVRVTAPAASTPRTGAVVARTDGLTVRYGDLVAVNAVDLDLHAGEVTGLMGRNGAGKSSLLWAVQGGIRSTGGLDVDGHDPRGLSAARARRLVTLVPQTASDLLYLPTVARELARADLETDAPAGTAAAWLGRLGITLDPDADPRDLSEGQRLGLVLALQLTASPRLLLLDEPTRGLDYAAKAQLAAMLADLAADGRAVVVSSHDVEFVAAATQRLVVMADGDIIADGATREVCTSSPTFAPQVAKVFAPVPVLTPAEVAGSRVRVGVPR